MQFSRRQMLLLGLGTIGLASLGSGCGSEQQPMELPRTTTLLWSPDGRQLAWGKPDGKIEVRDERGEQIITAFISQTGGIASLSWSPDGTLLASGSHDKSVHIWEAQTGKQIAVYGDYQGPVVGLGWSSDRKQLISIDSVQTKLRKQTPGESSHSEQQAAEGIQGVSLNVAAFSAKSPEAGYVAGYGYSNGMVGMQWFLEDSQAHNASCSLRAHVGPDQATLDIAWSPDGKYLAASGLDKRITVWQVGTCSNKAEYQQLSAPATSLAWAPDGRYIAAGIGQNIEIFRLAETKQAYESITKHKAPVRAVAWSSKNVGASVDEQQVLQLWKIKGS